MRNYVFKISISLLIIVSLSCHKDEYQYIDLCPGCLSHGKLNGVDLDLDPALCYFDDNPVIGDSLLYFEIYCNVPPDKYYDDLFFSKIPFKLDSISLPGSNGNSGPEVSFFVQDGGYDSTADIYEVAPGSNSYVIVDSVNHETHTLKIRFDLLLAVFGDTTLSAHNLSYPSILHFSEGEAELVVQE